MSYAVSTASLRRYHDDTLAPHAEALRDLEKGHAGRAIPSFPQGLTGTADLFRAVDGSLGQVLTDAARHASAGREKMAETTRRYDAAEAANLSYFGGEGSAPAAAAVPSLPALGDPPATSGDSRDPLAELRFATDRLSSVVAPLGGLPLVRPVVEQLWANAVDPRHYDTAAGVHAAYARHIADLRSRLAEPAVHWDGSAHDGFATDRNRHLATLDDAEAHSRTLSVAYGEMAASMREFLSHMALAIGAFLAAFALTLFVSHFFEAALFLCLAEIAAFVLYLAGWLGVRLVYMARTARRTLEG